MRVVKNVVMGIGRILLLALAILLFVSAAYAFSYSPVESSPLYNSYEAEMRAFLIYIPIISVVLAFALRIFFPSLYRWIFFLSWDEKVHLEAYRRMNEIQLELGRKKEKE